ncbi:MAG: alpha-L-fucosidase [Phycisphaerae bacterium]|nr:alpha-L-fucosidase [Phycisphaerae bacterium]
MQRSIRRFGSLAVVLSACLGGASTAPAAKYEPNWESLNSRQCPQWFVEAKFGIFIHWGVYSVPSWSPKGTYAEWYLHMLREGSHKGAVREFHERVYGKDFDYKQFAPMFHCELFNPDEWADVFKRSGARYVVLTSKHHDGFCLWPAPDSPGWNSVEAGPKRDLCGDLAKAVRSKGLKMGYYYSLYEWYHPVYRSDVKRYVETHMMPQIKDLVQRYRPALIFSDGEWDQPYQTWKSPEFLAWLYNEGPNPDEVVVDDRWGKGMRHKCGDYYTTEYAGTGGPGGKWHPWEECRGIGHSFGYNRNENIDDYASRMACIRMLIEIAANGGNLLLDIGPTADGRIPVIMQDRLIAIGKWLGVNGEAIYGTTAGPFRRPPAWGRATSKGDMLYLHILNWPVAGKLSVPNLKCKVTKAWMLADAERRPLAVEHGAERGIMVNLTGRCPQPDATVVALQLAGKPEVDDRVYPGADGSIVLHAADAQIHGKGLRFEKPQIEGGNLGYWGEPKDWASWEFAATHPGAYDVTLRYACPNGSQGSSFVVEVGDGRIETKVPSPTGSWDAYQTVSLGRIRMDKVGSHTLSVKPKGKTGEAVMNLKWITLRPAK